jgi:hypothetical protein
LLPALCLRALRSAVGPVRRIADLRGVGGRHRDALEREAIGQALAALATADMPFHVAGVDQPRKQLPSRRPGHARVLRDARGRRAWVLLNRLPGCSLGTGRGVVLDLAHNGVSPSVEPFSGVGRWTS